MRKIMLAIAMAGGHWLSAQTPKDSLSQKLNHVFAHIDPAQVASGRFYDKGMTFINPLAFSDSIPDTVNLDRFGLLYNTLRTAEQPGRNTLPDFVDLIGQSEAFPRTEVPLAFIDLDYHFLRGDALIGGKVRVENDQVIPVSPYTEFLAEATVRAVASTRLTAEGPDVTLLLPDFLWQADAGKPEAAVELDFGGGWQAIGKGGRVTAHFSGESGKRAIRYRVTAGGQTVSGSFDIHIIMTTTATADAEWQILPVTGQHSGGSAHIVYAWNNNSGHVKKPLIILEGVDYYQVAPDLIDGNWGWEKSQELFYRLQTTPNNLTSDYDFIYLDYAQGADAIDRNAAVFRALVGLVNADKVLGGSTEQNVVIGYSMGGLVARYGLSKMAKEGVNSQTRLLITHDSPHQGANIPLGLQYLFQEIKEDVAWTGLFPMIDQANAMFTSPASQQMLLYKATSSTGFASNSWISQVYTPMVTFAPGAQPFEVVATSLGSECGVKGFPSNQKLLEVKAQLKSYNIFNPLALAIAGATNWELKLAAYGMPESGSATIAKVRLDYTRYILWMIPVSVNLYDYDKGNPAGVPATDGVPGGYYPLSTFIKIPLAGFDIGLVRLRTGFTMANGFTFIPSKSALDIDGNSPAVYNQAYNAWTVLPANSRITTFRSAEPQGNVRNFEHVNLTPRHAEFMARSIRNQALTNICPVECALVNINTQSIAGPTVLCGPASNLDYVVSLSPCPGCTFSWSADNGFSITQGQGTLGIKISNSTNNGDYKIYFSASNGSSCVYQTFKTVHIGIPKPITVISTVNMPRGGKKITLNPSIGSHLDVDLSPNSPTVNCDIVAEFNPDNVLNLICGPTAHNCNTTVFRVTASNTCGNITRDFSAKCTANKSIINPPKPIKGINTSIEVTTTNVALIFPLNGIIEDKRGKTVLAFVADGPVFNLDISRLDAATYMLRLDPENENDQALFTIKNSAGEQLSLSPNPAFVGIDQNVEVELIEDTTLSDSISYQLEDFSGRTMQSWIGNSNSSFSLNGLQPGTYVVKASYGSQSVQQDIDFLLKGTPYITLSPNPTADIIHVKLNNPVYENEFSTQTQNTQQFAQQIPISVGLTYQVSNGINDVLSGQANLDDFEIDLSSLPPGIYTISVTDGLGLYAKHAQVLH